MNFRYNDFDYTNALSELWVSNDVKGISGLFVKVSSPQKSKLDRTGKTHQLNLGKRGKNKSRQEHPFGTTKQ